MSFNNLTLEEATGGLFASAGETRNRSAPSSIYRHPISPRAEAALQYIEQQFEKLTIAFSQHLNTLNPFTHETQIERAQDRLRTCRRAVIETADTRFGVENVDAALRSLGHNRYSLN